MTDVLVPNLADADVAGMAGLDTVHLQSIAAAHAGRGVISGCEVTVDTGLSLAVSIGRVANPTTSTPVSAQTVTLATGAGIALGQARRDLIVVDTVTGVASVKTGAPAAYQVAAFPASLPELPGLAATEALLATYWMGAGETAASAARLTPARAVVAAPTGPKNALDADTGIRGDGVTDDAAAISALLSAGGSVYFPAATYHLAAGVNCAQVADLAVLCDVGAIFDTTGEFIEDDLFDFTTDAATTPLRFSWHGGIINTAGVANAAGTNFQEGGKGFLRQGTNPTGDAFSFRSGYWIGPHIEGVSFYSKEDAHLAAPTDSQRQHWMGDYVNDRVSGGDSFIFINSGPGGFTIRDCLFAGSRDSAIYVANDGATVASALGHIETCRFYWCSEAVVAKGDAPYGMKVIGCEAYGCFWGFTVDHQQSAGNPGAPVVEYVDCTVRLYGAAFRVTEGIGTAFRGCRAIDGGHPNWHGVQTGTVGRVTLTGGASGSIDGITVNGVQIMSGPVAWAGSLYATALAVAANINTHTSSPDYKASALEFDNSVRIHSTTGSVDGAVVDSTATTITRTHQPMTWISPTARALEIIGSVSCEAVDLSVSADFTHAVAMAVLRPDIIHRAVHIQGLPAAEAAAGVDIQSQANRIAGLTVNVGELGGEYSVAGPANPDNNRFSGVDPSVAMGAGLVLLGSRSSATYTDIRHSRLTADVDRASNNTDYIATGLGFEDLKTGARYRVTGMVLVDGHATSGDIKFDWITPAGTQAGWWGMDAPAGGITGATNNAHFGARRWNETLTAIGVIVAPSFIQVYGEIELIADGDLELHFTQDQVNATPTSVLAGSWLQLERI